MIPITCNAVGDILAIATLVLDIGRALNESRGSPADYRAIVGELNSLNIVLSSVGRVAQLTADIDLRKEIVREVDRCGQDVQRALDRIFKFSALGLDADTNAALQLKLKRQWYKLEWRFGQRSKVQEVRADLAMATQRLTSYLAISSVDGINDLRTSTSQFNAMTAQIFTSLVENFAAVALRDAELSGAIRGNAAALGELRMVSRRELPAPQGWISNLDSGKAAAVALLCVVICAETSRAMRNALLLAAVCLLTTGGLMRQEHAVSGAVGYAESNSITLHDAMGRRLILPLELCETRELFHATLVNLFSRTNGRWFIDMHRYTLTPVKRRDIYLGTDWNIQPDTEIEMSIIVQFGTDLFVPRVQCPLCLVKTQIIRYAISRCSSCGTELQSYTGPFEQPEVFVDDIQRAPESIEYIVNDLGRFPRARPTSVSGTAHSRSGPRRSQLIASGGSPGPLSDTGAPAESPLPWRDQVRGFTRFSIQEQQSIYMSRVFSFDLCEDRSELHIAAENGQYACVARLLDQGKDVNISTPSGLTALHLASSSGHARVVELLLDHGAAIDVPTKNYVTPLAFAVIYHQVETAALLVARGAMVDASESLRVLVLHAAAYINDAGIIQVLVQLGLDVNGPFRGERALHVAVNWSKRESVEVLLRNGADPSLRSETGETPLSSAASLGNVEIFELIWASEGMADYASPSASGKDIGYLLCSAVEGGSPAIVATVLRRTGADVDVRFEDGTTPLSLASEFGLDKVMELLLAQGADLNVEALPPRWTGKEGAWNALHVAAYFGNAECIKILLQHGVNVNARTEHGDTALSLALEGRRKHWENHRWCIWRFDQVLDILVSPGTVVDERSSLLLEEIALLDGLLKYQSSGFAIPGAWCEEAGQDEDEDEDEDKD